jgi:hypothetical protein
MAFRGVLLSGVIAVSALTSSLSAQMATRKGPAGPDRSGFFISGGLGAGSAGMSCDGCTVDRSTGLSGYFRVGGTLNPHVRLGFESNGWVHSEQGVDENVGFYSGVGYFYPSLSNNLWLKAGAGVAHSKADDGVDELTTTGLGLSTGIGYDWSPNGKFAIVPYVNYLHQVSGEANFNGTGTGVSAHSNLFQFGVGFGYRH